MNPKTFSCYAYSPTPVHQYDADAACAQLNSKATLASIHNNEDNLFVFSLCGNAKRTCWIGLNRVANSRCSNISSG
jgi:hypothetical protein